MNLGFKKFEPLQICLVSTVLLNDGTRNKQFKYGLYVNANMEIKKLYTDQRILY